jgi:hypothetical protein
MFDTQTNQINQIMPSQMAPPASGAHGTCPACHTLDTPLVVRMRDSAANVEMLKNNNLSILITI